MYCVVGFIDKLKNFERQRALNRNVALESKARSLEARAIREKSELKRLKRIDSARKASSDLANFKAKQRKAKLKKISHAFGLDKKPKKRKSNTGGGFLDIM